MGSEIKVTNIKHSSSGSNNLVLASDGTTTTTLSSSANIKSAINASGSAPIYACRAWVNFDGTGTVAIRDSGNVSSITDNSSGNYTVNFTTAMEDANYCFTGSCDQEDASYFYIVQGFSGGTYSTSALQIEIASHNGSTTFHGRDTTTINIAIFR